MQKIGWTTPSLSIFFFKWSARTDSAFLKNCYHACALDIFKKSQAFQLKHYGRPGDFALYLENYLMDEGHTLDNGSVWHKDWPHNIYVSQWPIFHGPVILLNILRLIDGGILFRIMDQCDTKLGLIKQMWVSDLYFMVQWFCHISWRLFDGWRA